MSLKVWMVEIRAPFLLLPIILSSVGGLLAFYDGSFNSLYFGLFTVILVALHITVNTLNEYYDHKTGIDFNTRRTIFNGGSGILQKGLLTPNQVFRVALICFLASALLSSYLVYNVGAILLLIVVPGMMFSLFYTQLFARKMLGEISAGLGLGFLPILGSYMVNTSTISLNCIVLAVAGGILTFNLLLLNEFPDLDADKNGGRKNLVISLGVRKAAKLYTVLTFSVYAILVLFVALGTIPPLCLLGLLTLPFAYKAVNISFIDPTKGEKFVVGQKANVQVVLLTQVLLSMGIAVSLILAI
ncbi:MAG: prenyltransferase [Methanomassiliicoccales archaeon]|nr:prenyltransferase [Methanomassiliicoccales archaeon]